MNKATYVRDLFDGIADRYDRMNLIMTAGVWRFWQVAFRRHNGVREGQRVLDVGCGTGEQVRILARQVGPSGRVVGLDLSPRMLAVAEAKVAASPWAGRVELRQGDALCLPFPDGDFDAVTCAFALRNVADLDAALREMCRVLRPGGRVTILELSHPHPFVRRPFLFYFERVVPLLGRWASRRLPGRLPPYAWLPQSLRGFPSAPELARRLEAAGFEAVRFLPLTCGIACLHLGRRPG